MKLFIVEKIDAKILWLNEDESKHIVRVLRMKIGDKLHLTDGKGKLCEAEIACILNKKCKVKIIRFIHHCTGRDHYLHLGICPTKSNDRFEWFLEKATEIGIDEITILISEHSERRNFNLNRYKKIILSSVKQSLRSIVPKINSAIKVKDFLKNNTFDGQKMIAHCNSNFKRESIKTVLNKKINYLILIGPEGDFSPLEIEKAYQNDFSGVILSQNRLRTETAAIVVTTQVKLINA